MANSQIPTGGDGSRGMVKPNTGEGQAGQVKPGNIQNVVRPPAPGGSGGKGK